LTNFLIGKKIVSWTKPISTNGDRSGELTKFYIGYLHFVTTVKLFHFDTMISNVKFPLHTALIFMEQMKVQGLREKGLSQSHYSLQHIEGYKILCFKDKIYIPQPLRQRVLFWYHAYLLQTIRNAMTWPGLMHVERFCFTCPICQFTKKERKKYGLLPPKLAESDPWVIVCVDLVGPFTRRPLSKHSLCLLSL
jgi:hypothetical protein